MSADSAVVASDVGIVGADAATARYRGALAARLGGSGVAVQAFPGKGVGLVATRDARVGEVLFAEEPAVSHRFAGAVSLVDACFQCQRFIGTLQTQFDKLATVQIPEHLAAGLDAEEVAAMQEQYDAEFRHLPAKFRLPSVDSPACELSPVVACPHGCGAEFCGALCLDRALRQHHTLLCPALLASSASSSSDARGHGASAGGCGGGAAGHSHGSHDGSSIAAASGGDIGEGEINAAALFHSQAMQTTEMFVFAAKAVGRVLEAWVRNGNDLQAALAPFMALHWAPLWRVRALREAADRRIERLLAAEAEEEAAAATADATASGLSSGSGAVSRVTTADAGAGAAGAKPLVPLAEVLRSVTLADASAAAAAAVAEIAEVDVAAIRAQTEEQAADSAAILRVLVRQRMPAIVRAVQQQQQQQQGAAVKAAAPAAAAPAAAESPASAAAEAAGPGPAPVVAAPASAASSSSCGGCSTASHGHGHEHADAACHDSHGNTTNASTGSGGSGSSSGSSSLPALRDWELDELFDPSLYGRLVAACELNALEVKIDSPLRDYLNIIRSLPDDDAAAGGGGKGKGGGGRKKPGLRTRALAALAPVIEQLRAARAARKAMRKRLERMHAAAAAVEDDEDGEGASDDGASEGTGGGAACAAEEEEEEEEEEEGKAGGSDGSSSSGPEYDSDFDTDPDDEETDDDDAGTDAEASGMAPLSASEVRRLCPLSRGSGLFAAVSCLNHSCAPNVHVAYAEGDRRLAVLAKAPVGAGEELCLAYVDVEQSAPQRQADLLHYGFACGCPRCAADEVRVL